MTNNKHIINALPLVADVLGRKYGVRVHIGGDRAFTDGRDIHLPSLPLDADDTVRNLVRAYIDHESAHLRDTDFEALRSAKLSPLEHHIWNTLEDWRVEQRMAALFPGCRHNLTWLIRHIFLGAEAQKVPTEQQNPAISILNWLLYTVRSWDVPELGPLCAREAAIIEVAYPGLLAQLAAIMVTVPKRCRSTQDCLEVTREIVVILKQYLPRTPEQSGQGQAAQRKKTSGKQSAASEKTDQCALDPAGDGSAQDRSTPGKQLQALIHSPATELPADLGGILAQELSSARPEQGERLQVALPTNKQKSSFSPSDLDEARRATTALRTRLQALLQSQVSHPARSGYRGRLDAQRLHRLYSGNPRIFRAQAERVGIDTAVHILLDCSGSMGASAMELAGKACFAMASALHAIPGVNVAVTAFPGNPLPGDNYSNRWKSVAPILKHGERLHREFSLASNGDTPLGEALWWTVQQMQALHEKRKIILIITDGHPDSKALAQNAITTAKALGYELYGIGIGERTGIHNLLPASSMNILGLQDLASAMFSILGKSLLNSPHGANTIIRQK